jgi:Acetoacetate decarboxylase (ADC)
VTPKVQPQFVLPASATNSMAKLPTFVEHGGEIACRHPADAIDSRLYGFVIDADHDLLNRYCERMFNRPSGGNEKWRAAGSEVLLNFVDIPTMGSTDLLDRRLGVCAEREAAIWFPVVDHRSGRFGWAVPYMFVDSALALVGGREVYGFPKQMGTLDVPRAADDTAPQTLGVTSVTLATHSPESVAVDLPVIMAARPPRSEPVQLAKPWGDPAKALSDIAGAIVGAVDGTHHLTPEMLFFTQLVEENIPMVLLKQFRDAHQQAAACYQAVLSVDMAVTHFRRGGFADLAGEPMSRELGVSAQCGARLAFWLEFDFVVRLGKILWEASGGTR